MPEMNQTPEVSPAVIAYTIIHRANGDIEVVDAEMEGTQRVSTEVMYDDIEHIAETIKMNKYESAAYNACRKFYTDLMRLRQQEADSAAE